MTNPIVHVTVSQTQAPIPDNLQKTGALISQGGTVLAAQSFSLLTQYSDLAALLTAPLALTSLAWSSAYGGQVTATAAVAHGVTVGEQFVTTIAGAVPAGYNGKVNATATGASTFTYYLTANPGSETTPGTYTPRGVGDLDDMASTFFAQNPTIQGVYVLELGAGEAAAGVTTLGEFIGASPQFFYSYLVPRSWADDSSYLAFVNTFTGTSAKTYFFTTVNQQNLGGFSAQAAKSVVALIEAPSYSAWAADNVSAATWSGGIVTATMATNHGIKPNQTFKIAGGTPVGYNGTFVALPGTTGTALIYAVASNPGSYVSGAALVKNVYASAGLPPTEFSHAADYFTTLNYDPSNTNRVPPFAFSPMFGVTPFPTLGNSALLSTLDSSNVNYVGNASQGGITGEILFNGHTMDGRPFNYWYSVDWMQINAKLNLSAEIINGSANSINPLYYEQAGIDRLQQTLISTCGSAITFGLALGRVVPLSLDTIPLTKVLNAGTYAGNVIINAVPFQPYTRANPSHYRQGIYNGLSVTFTPLRGFESITVVINVTDFVS